MSSGDAVQKPSWISANLNIPTILTVGGMFYAGVTAYNNLTYQQTEEKAYRIERAGQTDTRFANIENQLRQFNEQNVPYRITVVEQDIKASRERMDRFAETIVGALDVIKRDINAGSSDIRVLGTQISSMERKLDELSKQPTPRRAAFPSREASAP